jgi:hypothetical protein
VDDDADDPGWRLTPRLLLFLVPGYLASSRKNGLANVDLLERMRQAWTAFTIALLAFGVVIYLVVPGSTEHRTTPFVIGLSIYTALCLFAEETFGRRSVKDVGPELVAAKYQARFFLRVAFSNSIALAAFVFTFTLGQWWLYWLFLPFALVGLWRAAPTRSRLAQEQDRLYGESCSISLVKALRNQATRG